MSRDEAAVDVPGSGPEPVPGAGPVTAGGARQPRALWTLGLFRSELSITFRRWRTLALLAVLAAVPVLVGVAVKIETSDGSTIGGGGEGGPAFIAQITNNGLFLVFTALAATLPFFLPDRKSVV